MNIKLVVGKVAGRKPDFAEVFPYSEHWLLELFPYKSLWKLFEALGLYLTELICA